MQSYDKNRTKAQSRMFIYAMAAIVAIMLYQEIPRVAFEAQRDKEQLLIDRGEQYSRAVNLFVRKFNRFPADFDALQNTQNLRFLRRKYIDPMTGKDDWRIIHVGPGGVFTDSLVYGKKKDDKQAADVQNFITELQHTGGNPVDPNQNLNVGMRQRQSDQPGAPGDPNNPPPQFDANGQPIPNGFGALQVFPNGQIVSGPQPGQQPGIQPGNQPGLPSQFQPAANAFPGGPPGQPFPNQPFAGQPFPGQQPNQPPPSAVAGLIGQILTTPRPGGLNGLGGVQQGTVDPNAAAQGATTSSLGTATPIATAAQTIGGGIAGVASKLQEDGIKVYKEQTSYHKWEFVYDITKDPARAGGAIPQGAPPPGTPIGGGPLNGNTPPNGAPPMNGIPAPNGTMPPTPPVPPQ